MYANYFDLNKENKKVYTFLGQNLKFVTFGHLLAQFDIVHKFI